MNTKYTIGIIYLNNCLKKNEIFNLLTNIYDKIENYHNISIIFNNNNSNVWNIIANFIVIAENLKK